MPKIKVMSWNIRHFGDRIKADHLSFIAFAINNSGADIVGIMEVVGDFGHKLLRKLLTALNQNKKKEWRGLISEPTLDSHSEQYIFLWNEKNGVRANVTTFMTPSIISDHAFDDHFNQNQINEIFQLLHSNDYILQGFFLHFEKINQLAYEQTDLDFIVKNGTFNYDDYDLEVIRNVLIAHRNLGLNASDIRPPFQGVFEIGPNRLDLPVILYHAPGMLNRPLYIALGISVLCNSDLAQNFDDGIIMGDFNLDKGKRPAQIITLIDGETLRNKKNMEIERDVFLSLTDLDYQERLNAPTSLRRKLLKYSVASKRYLGKNYDRFFLKERPNSQFTFDRAQVHDLIRKIMRDVNYKEAISPFVNNPKFKNWTVQDAFEGYTEISDHMPILMTLEY